MSQEFDNKVLNLVKQNVFYPYEYMTDFDVWNNFEMIMLKDYHDLYLKCDVLLLADVFEKLRKNSLTLSGLVVGKGGGGMGDHSYKEYNFCKANCIDLKFYDFS